MEVEFSGIERIDTSWVQPTYRKATPPINADKRKVGLPCLPCLPAGHDSVPAWQHSPRCPLPLSQSCLPGLPLCPACCRPLLLQVQRYVVQSRLQAATQGTFSDLSLRRFVVRCARCRPELR